VFCRIYGGGLQLGTAGQQYYDGSTLAAYEDVIVVTVNYRTNVFGKLRRRYVPGQDTANEHAL